jgi:hypothetical protein
VSDLDCGAVDPPNEIDAISMMRFRGFSEEEIEEMLASGGLSQSSLDGFINYETDHDALCTQASSLSNFGTQIDFTEEYVAADGIVYLFLFSRGTALGAGSVTMAFAKPSESSTIAELHAEPGCGMRTVEADLTTLEPVSVPFDGPTIVDWSSVTVDGQGSPLFAGNFDGATLWFFADARLADVAGRVIDLDEFATERYHLEIPGNRSLSLTDLMSLDGRPFASFQRDEDGVWLFGLTCTTCLNGDLPQVLAVFEPVEGL